MKNSNDTIGDRTHYLLACSAVPQLMALTHSPSSLYVQSILSKIVVIWHVTMLSFFFCHVLNVQVSTVNIVDLSNIKGRT